MDPIHENAAPPAVSDQVTDGAHEKATAPFGENDNAFENKPLPAILGQVADKACDKGVETQGIESNFGENDDASENKPLPAILSQMADEECDKDVEIQGIVCDFCKYVGTTLRATPEFHPMFDRPTLQKPLSGYHTQPQTEQLFDTILGWMKIFGVVPMPVHTPLLFTWMDGHAYPKYETSLTVMGMYREILTEKWTKDESFAKAFGDALPSCVVPFCDSIWKLQLQNPGLHKKFKDMVMNQTGLSAPVISQLEELYNKYVGVYMSYSYNMMKLMEQSVFEVLGVPRDLHAHLGLQPQVPELRYLSAYNRNKLHFEWEAMRVFIHELMSDPDNPENRVGRTMHCLFMCVMTVTNKTFDPALGLSAFADTGKYGQEPPLVVQE